MREDLVKASREKPRRKSSKYPSAQRFSGKVNDPEDEKEFGGIHTKSLKGKERGDYKHIVYPDATVYKVLKAQVGRPWDKVYSELCEINRKSDKASHLFEKAVKNYVVKDVEIVDKKPYEKANYRWQSGIYPLTGLYVHPETGLLCYQEASKRVRKPKAITQLDAGNGWKYTLIDGSWFVTKYEETPTKRFIYLNPSDYNYEATKKRKKSEGTWESKKYGEGYYYNSIKSKTTKHSCNKQQLKLIKEYLEKYNG